MKLNTVLMNLVKDVLMGFRWCKMLKVALGRQEKPISNRQVQEGLRTHLKMSLKCRTLREKTVEFTGAR